jgi:hypothetical protein
MTTDTTAAPARERRGPFLLVLLAIGAIAAGVGAYLDWMWWVFYTGLMITLVAIALLLVGAIVALFPRRMIRRTGLVILSVGVGLLTGQNLGPSREPLIQQSGGSITLHLESPVQGTATGEAWCQNVASGTEFSVSGDPNVRLDTDRSFVSISMDKGDRWEALRGRPRTDGVWLLITVTPERVPAGGKPATIGMESAPESAVVAAFTNEGGQLTFAGLEAATGPDYTGDSLDLAGTIEWDCGPPVEMSSAR